MPSALEPARHARSLDFWFDYTCPYAYLGFTQLPAVGAKLGLEPRVQPMLLGGVFRANDTPQKLFATLSPAKAAHNAADLDRWARRFGVPLRMPSAHPFRSVDALRATLVVGCDPRVIRGFYDAYWDRNEDIASESVIAAVLREAGHDPDVVLPKLSEQAVKDELRARTDRAIALGIFGAPTWVVDEEHLYWGQDRIDFVVGAPAHARSTPARSSGRLLEVYWDFSSPFAYLGVAQAEALAARTGAALVSRPMLLGGLFKALGQADVPLATWSPAKQAYTMKDLERWAVHWGVPFRYPSRFPTSSLRALRVHAAMPADAQAAFRDATFRAYWAEDRDITDVAVLGALVDAAGGDAADVLARSESPDIKATVRAHTERALEQGVFGAPTWVVDGQELYWGQDRIDLVEDALLGGPISP